MAVSADTESSSGPSTVDIAIEGVPDADKVTVGGLVIRRADNNNAPRKKITLSTDIVGGNVTLTRNNSKVKVFTAATGGTEILFNGTANKFAVTALPKDLFVQGDEGSGAMRDVTLTLTHDNGESDVVKFTVLWVVVTTKHTGTIALDNSARNEQYAHSVPPSYNLGLIYEIYSTTAWIGRLSEFIGTVEPSDFVPSQFGGSMLLAREFQTNGMHWTGTPNGNEHAERLGGSDDTSPPAWRDDDPQSDGSGGKIYDLDTPRAPTLWTSAANMIWRYRRNYRAFAKYDGIRCSPMKLWYTRQSYKLTGSVDSGTAKSGGAGTLTDTDKAWVADMWTPGAVGILGGTGPDQVRLVTGNTATVLAVSPNWTTQPDNTSQYRVVNTSTWTQLNDVANDNVNGDGTTKVSWDLQSPTVTGITPNSGTNETTVTITNLAGTSFAPNATIMLKRDATTFIAATDVVWVSVSKFTCKFALSGSTQGNGMLK